MKDVGQEGGKHVQSSQSTLVNYLSEFVIGVWYLGREDKAASTANGIDEEHGASNVTEASTTGLSEK